MGLLTLMLYKTLAETIANKAEESWMGRVVGLLFTMARLPLPQHIDSSRVVYVNFQTYRWRIPLRLHHAADVAYITTIHI